LRAGYSNNIFFNVLTSDQCQALHAAVLEVLGEVGVIVESRAALEVLMKSGASVSGNLVKISASLVESAIKTVPSRLVLYDRNGSEQLYLEDRNCYFGSGLTTTYTTDPYTGERRHPCKQDTRNAARVMDGLKNIDFVMDFGLIHDVPNEYADVHMLQAMLENTTKHIIHWGNSVENYKTMLDMCIEIAGSLEDFQRHPFVSFLSAAFSPLQHEGVQIDRVMFLAEKNLPVLYVSAPMAGGTSPVTLVGTLVIAIAECLSGLVIGQLKKEGTPFIMSGLVSTCDMNSMIMNYGSPEFSLLHAAFAEMCRFYKIPMWGTAGCSDSKITDQQAAVEATGSIMLSAMSGGNLVHDLGFIEYGSRTDLGQLVMCDEIVGYVRRIIKGIEFNGLDEAVDVIKKVGPGGHFLNEQHTFDHFKNELWFPEIMDRKRFEVWLKGGSLSLGDRAMSKARDLIENHKPEPLSEATANKINQIVLNFTG
jgi:trimethylamine---corrinoid protein Co-methyltransferase